MPLAMGMGMTQRTSCLVLASACIVIGCATTPDEPIPDGVGFGVGGAGSAGSAGAAGAGASGTETGGAAGAAGGASASVGGSAGAAGAAAGGAGGTTEPPSAGGAGAAPGGSAKKKWHPGHYMNFLRNSDSQTVRFGYLDEIAGDSAIAGVMLPIRWSQVESKQGDYSLGIATVKAYLKKLASLPTSKRLVLMMHDYDYGHTGSTSSYFPDYINGTYTYSGSHGVGWCRWNSSAMSHYIEMIEALGAALDDEPLFEGIYFTSETAAQTTTACGYSQAAYSARLAELAAATSKVFPRSNVIASVNFFSGGQSAVDAYIHSLEALGVGVGGPDILPGKPTFGYLTLMGKSGGKDLRGTLPVQFQVQASEMGSSLGDFSIDELRDYADDSLHASHLFWDRNTWTGTPAQRWANAGGACTKGLTCGIRDYITTPANALTHTSCPLVYSQGCDTK